MSWKTSNITPIQNKGSRTAVGNYRPVSLTSVVVKVMESIIRDHLLDHMMKNKSFCDAEHGFDPGRSCMTQLLVVIELWREMLDSGDPVDAIYLDFSKAFDIVPHQRLFNKVKTYGVVGDTYEWIKAFLIWHTHQIIANSSLSSWLEMLSGIPQGSVLGPILFVLFINDLPDMVQSTAHIFADDTKVYRKVLTDQDCIEHKQTLQDSTELFTTLVRPHLEYGNIIWHP